MRHLTINDWKWYDKERSVNFFYCVMNFDKGTKKCLMGGETRLLLYCLNCNLSKKITCISTLEERKRPKNTFFPIFEIWLLDEFDEFPTKLLENIVFESGSPKLSSFAP